MQLCHTFNDEPSPLRISQTLPRFNVYAPGAVSTPFFEEVSDDASAASQVIRVFNEVHIPRRTNLPRVLSIDEFKGNGES